MIEMNKTEPRTLPGFMELLPQEQILFNQMKDTIRKNYEKFQSTFGKSRGRN